MAQIQITPDLAIDESELDFEFSRAAGPGGQNVNKVATAVQLRFDVQNSASLPELVRARLFQVAGKRISRDGILVIDARQYRSQARNRAEALRRFLALVKKAAEPVRERKATKPPAVAHKKRLETKRRRSEKKQRRRPIRPEED